MSVATEPQKYHICGFEMIKIESKNHGEISGFIRMYNEKVLQIVRNRKFFADILVLLNQRVFPKWTKNTTTYAVALTSHGREDIYLFFIEEAVEEIPHLGDQTSLLKREVETLTVLVMENDADQTLSDEEESLKETGKIK